jgi:hypothetical protein
MNAVVARGYCAPYIGLVAFAAVMLTLPFGHTLLVLLRNAFEGTAEIVVSIGLGLGGWLLVWKGRKQTETVGSWMGFIAGQMIWLGWFELAWKIFAHALNVQPVRWNGGPLLSGELQVIQMTGVPLFVFLCFLYLNKETRCNAVLWIRRQLRMDPGRPVTGKDRNFAALTALETVSVTWACYVIIVCAYDPRIGLGPTSIPAMALFTGCVVWGVWLVSRLLKYANIAPALRYAIPTGNILWISVEAGSRMRLYPEIWIKPFQYPLEMTLITLAMVAMLTFIRFAPEKGGQNEAAA